MATGIRSSGGFKVIAPVFPYGSDPSRNTMAQPDPQWRNVTYGQVLSDGGQAVNGLYATGGAAYAPATGSFAVADNTFPAPVELILGQNTRLVNGADYAVGANVNATAVNMAAAISKVPTFAATSVGATVTVTCSLPADDTEFRAIQHGGVISLNAFTGGGWLTKGVPYAGSPTLGLT